MKRRYALYLSAAAPAVAAVTVVGTGVSQAEVSQVSPGPRVVADAAVGTPAPEATHPRPAASHRTKPVVNLTCHETDKPATTPTAGTSTRPATSTHTSGTHTSDTDKSDTGTSGAGPSGTGPSGTKTTPAASTATTDSDSVVCHWSHIRRHLKAASFVLLRGTTGSGAPAPSAIKTFDAKAGKYTDTTVADGTSYTYVLHALASDGSEVGTSNTVTVRDRDDRPKPASDEAKTGPGSAPTTAKTDKPDGSATASNTDKPDTSTKPSNTGTRDTGPTPAPHHAPSGGAGPNGQHRSFNHHDSGSDTSRSHPGPSGQANDD